MSYILQALKKSEQERELASQELLVSSFNNPQSQGSDTDSVMTDSMVELPHETQDERMIPLSVYAWLGAFVITLLVISAYVQMEFGSSSDSKPLATDASVTQSMDVTAVAVQINEISAEKSKALIGSVINTAPEILIQEESPQKPQIIKPQIIKPAIQAEQASENLQSMIPNIEVSSHIYSSLPGRRSIVVNGQRLVETDFISPLVQVKEITHQGMVIDVDGSPLTIDRSRGWSR